MASGARPNVKLTYADYARIPDDRLQHEIIDGEHYVTLGPTPHHQRVSRRILVQLCAQVDPRRLGEVFYAPIDLQLSEHDVVQPDLVLVLEGQQIVTTTRILGVPALVVEVLSPSTRRHDRQRKRWLYERAGVPEYWVVDPRDEVVEQLRIEDGRYVLLGKHSDAITFAGPADLRVDLRQVW